MVTGGSASRFQTGHDYTGGKYAELIYPRATEISGNAETNLNFTHQTDTRFPNNLHKCVKCDSVFFDRSKLRHHIKLKHSGSRITCPLCPGTFSTFSCLNEHVKFVHEKRPRYQCESCGKGFINRLHYLDHLATHSGSKRHVCSICGSQFTFKPSLKRHVLHFHPDEAAHV